MADKKNLIIGELETMEQGDIIRGEKFSALAYRKVINGLRPLQEIRTLADIEGIKGIGVKIKAKIQEILDTGRLEAATRTRTELKMDLYDQLLGVHGIGPVKARELVAAGVMSIEDLRT
jgi:DNA polymerase/3'-5' exonuclease PolX